MLWKLLHAIHGRSVWLLITDIIIRSVFAMEYRRVPVSDHSATTDNAAISNRHLPGTLSTTGIQSTVLIRNRCTPIIVYPPDSDMHMNGKSEKGKSERIGSVPPHAQKRMLKSPTVTRTPPHTSVMLPRPHLLYMDIPHSTEFTFLVKSGFCGWAGAGGKG